jgi:hypothetical protein
LGRKLYRILIFIQKLKRIKKKFHKSIERVVLTMGFPMIPLSGRSQLAAVGPFKRQATLHDCLPSIWL